MVAKTDKKIKLKNTLDNFLFNKIEQNLEYQRWKTEFEIPKYITDNLSKTLRDYQETAVKHFIWLHQSKPTEVRHLLFNMATGTGKTLIMAAIVLYLYKQGYRNFMFLVHQLQIKNQAVKNFTDPSFEKYLFAKNIKLDGKNIRIKIVERFEDAKKDGINFMFFSTSMLYLRLITPKENSLTAEGFKDNKTVIIADEAHRLNVDTRKKLSKTDKKDIENWETAVQRALNTNNDNILLEFTATVDLKNDAIHRKYSDKLIYRYDFLQFNQDRYSKQVGFLYNEETQIEDQKRMLIINAVALSEYRRLYAEREMRVIINPIILVKSVKISQSEEDRNFFHKVINSLRVQDFEHLENLGKGQQQFSDSPYDFLTKMFTWLASKKSGLLTAKDISGLTSFINTIKERFSEHNSIVYNSQNKEKADLLPLLDSPRNTMRVIFSVNALNEGWDVLSLYDIIHFDISANKKVSLQDIQLIGRGARLYPYDLPKQYKQVCEKEQINENLFSNQTYSFDRFKRKFDNAPDDNGRILETFYYHFVKTGTFLSHLQELLLGEGIINQGIEKRTIRLKSKFLESGTYKKGFVLVNEQKIRTKMKAEEINATFDREIMANIYQVQTRVLSDIEQNKHQATMHYRNISLTQQYFSEYILRKALMVAENGFFHFENLKKHLVGIKSIDDLIFKKEYLPKYNIKYSYSGNKDIYNLTSDEKLQLLISGILPEVRKSINIYMPVVTGTHIFKPKPLSEIFSQEKNIFLVAYPIKDKNTGNTHYNTIDERSKAQSNHQNPELQYDVNTANWYAYDENYGTSEEKRFVKYIATQINVLKQRYPNAEIYLIRNELDYFLFSPKSGRRFSPDYMMIINDTKNNQLYYQCLLEAKGSHLLEKDAWKEEVLIDLNNHTQICFDINKEDEHNYEAFLDEIKKREYQEVKCLGFKFFNTDTRGVSNFGTDFQNQLLHPNT